MGFIGIGQNGRFYRPQKVLAKCCYSSRIQTTWARKHSKPS